jgi:hypothetical protein
MYNEKPGSKRDLHGYERAFEKCKTWNQHLFGTICFLMFTVFKNREWILTSLRPQVIAIYLFHQLVLDCIQIEAEGGGCSDVIHPGTRAGYTNVLVCPGKDGCGGRGLG